MVKGYIRVTGNSNIAFGYPLGALIITNDIAESDFEPNISALLDDDRTFNNWMYIRRKED